MQAAKRDLSAETLRIEGEDIRITGRPDVERVTIHIGAIEICIGSEEARNFALLLFAVASGITSERLGDPSSADVTGRAAERVM